MTESLAIREHPPSHRVIRWAAPIMLLSTFLIANSAFGISLTLSQVGGTAVNGRGVVGDTI